MKSRQADSSVLAPSESKVQTGGGSIQTTQQPGRYRIVDVSTLLSQTVPKYHKRLKNGELLPHTYFRQHFCKGVTTSFTYDIFTVATNTRNWWVNGAVLRGDLEFSADYLEAKLMSQNPNFAYYVQSAAASIYSKGFDGLTFLAELPQAIQMFKNILKKLWRIMQGKSPGTPWDLWLEGRYGWRTLINDLINLDKVLHEIDFKRKRYSERVGTSWSFSEVTSTVLNQTAYTGTDILETNFEVSIRGSVTADISLSKWRANPIVTGWEVVRLSFVIDWLLNVGQALEALSFKALASNYSSSWGAFLSCVSTRQVSTSMKAGYTGSYFYSRVIDAQLQLRTPSSVPNSPLLKLRLNEFKVLDLISLILQKFKS